jgi:hypothetical protein
MGEFWGLWILQVFGIYFLEDSGRFARRGKCGYLASLGNGRQSNDRDKNNGKDKYRDSSLRSE